MAITHVKTLGTGNVNGGTSFTITVPTGGVPIGDLVVVGVNKSSGTDVTSVTDTAGNTYASRRSVANGTQTVTSLWASKLAVALAATNTITVTGASATMCGAAGQFSGADNLVDVSGSATGSGTAPPSLTVTTTATGDLAVAALGCWFADAVEAMTTTPTGWTQENQINPATFATNMWLGYIIQGAAGATPNISTGGYPDSVTSADVIVTFKVAAPVSAVRPFQIERPFTPIVRASFF